jgi:Pyruvate/2-oxoacid:ferredoxin oxidoreductase delta subunit
MCQLCLKHGAGGKWYLNAKSYSEEVARRYNLREFLMEQYKNFEQISVRPVAGVSPAGMDHAFRMPIIGRLIKKQAEKMLHSTRPPSNPFKPEGHIGQVVPLEDAIAILEQCAAEPIIEKNCMCRYMTRGEKESCCINFGVMSEIIDKLPRFIPEKDKYHLTRAEAVKRFTEHNNKGYIGTIWYGPYPYINNLCSCKTPECAGIRPRVDFGIKSIFKAEYLVELNQDLCRGCQSCIVQCPFKAISLDTATGRIVIDRKNCYGCGVCRHVCVTGALFLVPRQETGGDAGRPGANGGRRARVRAEIY